jgi:hypothetical protein
MYLIDSETERPDHHVRGTEPQGSSIKKRKTDGHSTLPTKTKKINVPQKVVTKGRILH